MVKLLYFFVVGAIFWIGPVFSPALAQTETPQPNRPFPDPTDPTRPAPLDPPIPEPAPQDPSLQLPEEPAEEIEPPDEIPGGEDIVFEVDRIEVLGNTVLETEIAELVRPLEGQQLSLNELLDLRTQITNLYIQNGYVTSGAFLPNNQDLTDGVVQIQVIEGGNRENPN